MKKQQIAMNRTGVQAATSKKAEAVVLTDRGLSRVLGGGGAASPDLYPVGSGGDSGPTS
jgi:hypothetical protein